MKLAITADLHWGHRKGNEPTRQLAARLQQQPPDILLIAGDIGTGIMFEQCLQLFADLPCLKALVPGNHDIWVSQEELQYDSLDLYQTLLPEVARRLGFRYLDRDPLLVSDELAIVGSINWYDYSWGIEGLRRLHPGEEGRLKTKRFTRGRHNDGVFVRWPTNDIEFTARVVATLEQQLAAVAPRAKQLIVMTHHPPIYDLGFPQTLPLVELDALLWDSLCGNASIEALLSRYAAKIAYLFCGHTHRSRQTVWKGVRGYNVGSDYPSKRLLWLDWDTGEMTAEEFADPPP